MAVIRPDQCMVPASTTFSEYHEANDQSRCLPGHFTGRSRRSRQIFRRLRFTAVGGYAWSIGYVLELWKSPKSFEGDTQESRMFCNVKINQTEDQRIFEMCVQQMVLFISEF